jgi:hypothetical protein
MRRSNVAQTRGIVEMSAGGSTMRKALNFMRTGVSGWTMIKTADDEADAATARGGICGHCHQRVALTIGPVPDFVLLQGELRHLSCFVSEVQGDRRIPGEAKHSTSATGWQRL